MSKIRRLTDQEKFTSVGLRQEIRKTILAHLAGPKKGSGNTNKIRGQGLTFKELKEFFLAAQQTRAKNREIKNSYLNDFVRRLSYFETALGAKTCIKDLTKQQITDAVYNKKSAKSPKTKLEYFVSLKAMLTFGEEEGLIFGTQINALMPKKSRPRQQGKTEQRIPSPEMMHKLIHSRVSWWSDEEYDFWVAFKLVLATTGIRVGEAAGASWENLHLRAEGSNQNRLFVGQARDSDGKLAGPKTESGLRDVPLSSEVGNRLLMLPKTCDLIFPCPRLGKPRRGVRSPISESCRLLSPGEVWRLAIEPVVQEFNLPWSKRTHIIRHFQASNMINLGWDIKKVQKRLGHSRATTTLDTYGHLYERADFDSESEEMSRGLI
jgi:integrase